MIIVIYKVINTSIFMKCPECGCDEKKENISFKNKFLGFKKVKKICYFCPLCEFSNEKEFGLTKTDYEIEIIQRTNLEKKSKQTFETKKH